MLSFSLAEIRRGRDRGEAQPVFSDVSASSVRSGNLLAITSIQSLRIRFSSAICAAARSSTNAIAFLTFAWAAA